MTQYLTTIEVLHMQRYLVDRFGGTHGIRDPGALEAALYRPQSGYYKDTLAQAAALWESVTNNHPFIDGNKRIGFAVTDTFLRLNGYKITADPDTIYKFMDGLFNNNQFRFDRLEPWLRKNTTTV